MTLKYMNKYITQQMVIIMNTSMKNNAVIKHNRKHFLSRAKIKNYNALIDGRNFSDLLKQYDEIRFFSTG